MRNILLTRESSFRHTLFVFVSGLAFASTIVLLLNILGFDAVAAVRDRALSDAPEAGLISDIGILLTALAGCFALVRGISSASLAIGALGLFCCIFAMDDAIMLHERLGRLEVIFFAFYGLLAVAIIFLFRAGTQHGFPWPMIIVLVAFVASVVVDVLWGVLIAQFFPTADPSGGIHNVGFILEDVPKFGGIIVLASFAIGEAMLYRR